MDYLCDSINALFKSLMFPNSLKLADVTPIHKKGMKELKEDYRSVSILPTSSVSILPTVSGDTDHAKNEKFYKFHEYILFKCIC